MNEPPLVSIVIPNLNGANFLEQAIRSVLDQDYPRIELILIDGGSTDGSLEIIQRYAESASYWVSEPDRGQSHAVNKGLRQAHGAILSWLNSDDLLSTGTVSRIIEVFQEHPAVDLIHGRVQRIDEAGRLIPTPLLPKDTVDFGADKVLGECVINQPGAFWRREIMERTGLLDEELHFAMDYEYWARMALAGANFHRLHQVLAQFRLSSGSKTVGQTAAMAKEQLVVLDRLLSIPNLVGSMNISPAQARRQARATRARICLQVAYGCFKDRRLVPALGYFFKAVVNDPSALFDPRYRLLLIASLKRRRGTPAGLL